MSKQVGLIANLDLCMGCFACEVSCQQEKGLSEGQMGIQVITIGPYEIDGQLAMDFVPMARDACDLCKDRCTEGNRPFCAEICPTRALTLQKESELLNMLRGNGRFHLCKSDFQE